MSDKMDIWAQVSAELPKDSISWRQDGKPTQRDGKFVARFVAYTDAQVVRERLDAVVPGEWDLTLELLPHASDADGEAICAFKARLQVLGIHREDVGQGKDYKSASTDAFKRAAVRFGIGHELYSMGQVWVAVDGDGKYAKPLEDPSAVYARKQGKRDDTPHQTPHQEAPQRQVVPESAERVSPFNVEEPSCPKCGGRMWSNVAENDARAAKGEKLRPDHKCRNRSCDGVLWRPKPKPAQQQEEWTPDKTQVPF